MFSTFWSYGLTLLWLALVYTTLTIFDCLCVSDNWYLDVGTRLNQSDSIINLFNFFWTSTTYLSILFFTLTILWLLLSFAYTHTAVLCLFFAATAFNIVECFDFLVANVESISLVGGKSEVNLLLSNNLNKYHPLILYWSTFALITNIFLSLNYHLAKPLFSTSMNSNKFLLLNLNVFYINFIALALGSWWALQEGTWGGWWNWDASEVLGLVVLLISLLFLHKTLGTLSYSKVVDSALVGLLLLIFSYFFLQLNFELTSHSFGSRFTYFFNNNLFFIENLLLCTLMLRLRLKLSFMQRTTYLSLVQTLPRTTLGSGKVSTTLIFWLMSIVGLLVIILSFMPLLNYFFWRYLKVNTFNSFVSIEVVVFFMTISLALLFSVINWKVIPLLIIVAMLRLDFILLLALLSPLKWSIHSCLHHLILLFLLVNVWSYQFQLVTWSNTPLSGSICDGLASVQLKQVNYVCNNFFVDKAIFYDNGSFGSISYVNFFYKANSVQLNNFILYITNTNAGSLFYNNFSWQSVLMVLELLTWPNLNEILVIFFAVNLYIGLKSILSYKPNL